MITAPPLPPTFNVPKSTTASKSKQQAQQPHINFNALSEWQRYRNNFCSGALALSTAFAFMHPLDTLKTRLQAAAGSTASTTTLRSVILSPDFLRTLGRGFVTSVAGAGPQGGLRLSSYEFAKHHLQRHPVPRSARTGAPEPQYRFGMTAMTASAVSAVVGDLASSIVKVPREVVTSRLQTAGQGVKSEATAVIREILATKGVGGLFQGFWSTTARDAPFMIILFCTYEGFKQHQHRFVLPSAYARAKVADEDADEDVPAITTLRSTLFGGLSGALAGFLTTPFDVIKTKVMTNTGRRAGSMFAVAGELVRSQRASMIAVAAAKGGKGAGISPVAPYSVFFTGAAARSVWWFGICSMFFPIYERSKEMLYMVSI
ncbi:S-adenosylmethionine transporter [Irineochytrium annulatum]|nr:S-adenosylmethionine transporter [Irineochytrium annulatum]